MSGSPILGFIAIFIVSIVSLIGIVFISVNKKKLDNFLFYIVAFATGAILSTTFFDLLPEALEFFHENPGGPAFMGETWPYFLVVLGFFVFYLIEHYLNSVHFHHHSKVNIEHSKALEHEECLAAHCDEPLEPCENPSHTGRLAHDVAIMNIIGDSMHNFLDGIIIMVAFLHGNFDGLIVTAAVFLHELPQEIGDFSISVSGGLSTRKALKWNFISALTAFLGGIFAWLLSGVVTDLSAIFMAFSAGGFLYIATVKLMPSLVDQNNRKKSLIQAWVCVLGLVIIWVFILLMPHQH